MEFRDSEAGIVIDSDFPCGSAGQIRKQGEDLYEVDYQREPLPEWFQAVGQGVPKEYAFCVRVRNAGPHPRRIVLRFLMSPKGSAYLAPPWWIQDQEGWAWVPFEDVVADKEEEGAEVALTIAAGQTVVVASAPFVDPDKVCERARQLAGHFDLWTYREIGSTAQGRPIPVLESAPRPLKVAVSATAQSCEPVFWGILHIAHWLTIPTARTRDLLEEVQFCLLPVTNPDGAAAGLSVTNGLGEVPKFSWDQVAQGADGPAETRALWDYYLNEARPDVEVEVHAHFRWERMWRTIGTDVNPALPPALRAKGAILERALRQNFPDTLPENDMSMIDYRRPEHEVYGDQYFNEKGILRAFLQAIPETIESHGADVQEMVETVAEALIEWRGAAGEES